MLSSKEIKRKTSYLYSIAWDKRGKAILARVDKYLAKTAKERRIERAENRRKELKKLDKKFNK